MYFLNLMSNLYLMYFFHKPNTLKHLLTSAIIIIKQEINLMKTGWVQGTVFLYCFNDQYRNQTYSIMIVKNHSWEIAEVNWKIVFTIFCSFSWTVFLESVRQLLGRSLWLFSYVCFCCYCATVDRITAELKLSLIVSTSYHFGSTTPTFSLSFVFTDNIMKLIQAEWTVSYSLATRTSTSKETICSELKQITFRAS